MEIAFTPELEAKLNRIASETGRATNRLVIEAVATHLDHEEWFRRQVEKGLTSLDRGDFLSHDEVGRRMDQTLRS